MRFLGMGQGSASDHAETPQSFEGGVVFKIPAEKLEPAFTHASNE